ncbi:MAG TPA: V-type ATP synthase subunit E family protein [Gallionellaceae bacterium]|nr:V-type ATP synthase subunit E family protein [Gallionellaceae bacterium]
MSTPADDLETALLARAQMQAQEYLDSAAVRRQEIITEGIERLHLREEREVLAARAAADKLQRQQVQSAEIHLTSEYDRLRWTLVQSVLAQLDEALLTLANDEARYLPVLAGFIRTAARSIEGDTLVVELNARDLARLGNRWESYSKDLAPGKTLQLAQQPIHCSGGAMLHDPDNRIRVNQTFEGRKQRMNETLTQAVLEKLFAAVKK